MTVKEVFDLRKQGKIEEAYEAIRPMYAVHKGKYTTLCMFWVGSDIMKKRLQENQTAEATKIFEALLHVAPNIDDKDNKVHEAVLHNALRLKEAVPSFSLLDFMKLYGIDHLTDADWQGSMSVPKEGTTERPHPLPSTAQRIVTHCFHELQQHPDADHAQMSMPLLQEAMRRLPRDKHSRRYMAVAYHIAGEDQKAADIYRSLLKRHHDSYLYAELAELTTEPGPKAALLCQAILHQRQEKFSTNPLTTCFGFSSNSLMPTPSPMPTNATSTAAWLPNTLSDTFRWLLITLNYKSSAWPKKSSSPPNATVGHENQ